MNLNSKILTILKESEDGLFKPRRVKDREDKLKKEIKQLKLKYPYIENIYDVYISFNEIYDTSSYVLAKNEEEAFKLALPSASKEAKSYFPKSFYRIPINEIEITDKNIQKVIDDLDVLNFLLDEVEDDPEILKVLKGKKKVYIYVSGT